MERGRTSEEEVCGAREEVKREERGGKERGYSHGTEDARDGREYVHKTNHDSLFQKHIIKLGCSTASAGTSNTSLNTMQI